MNEEKPIQVSEELYVNEATLELLRRRIESAVKSDFFRWIGIPIGGAGALAFAYAIFLYIPQNISQFVEDFLKSEAGNKVVTTQVNSSVREYFADPDSGRKFIKKLVAGFLASSEGQKLIQDQVKRELEPRVTSLLEPIKKNADQLVHQAESLPEVSEVQKRSIPDLRRFLRGSEASRLKEGPGFIALTKLIRHRQGGRYDFNVIIGYLDILQQEFGEKFRHVVLTDSDGFIARIDPKLFKIGLQQHRNRLMGILNAERGRLPRKEAQEQLNRIFGLRVTDAIPESWKVARALREPMWESPPDPHKEVAVLGEQDRFIGTTTRERLLGAIFTGTAG